MCLNLKQKEFVQEVIISMRNGDLKNRRASEKLAQSFDIYDITLVKELVELAIVLESRDLIRVSDSRKSAFTKLVKLYNKQINISLRTSKSILLQQYSTPAPISFIASSYIQKEQSFGSVKKGRFSKNHFTHTPDKQELLNTDEPIYLEPSAGNGLLTIALPYDQTIVNEIDEVRNCNLESQSYRYVFKADATIPFINFHKKFDGIVTNPPFGTLPEKVSYDTIDIKNLDFLMTLRALDTMKDNGKAAIIIGAHTAWDAKGRIQKGKNREFLNYLYQHYNVEDIILINGRELYRKQGTAFNTRLILINGRKTTPIGYAPVRTDELAKIESDFMELYERVFGNINRKENWKKTSQELIQESIENLSIFKDQSAVHWFTEYAKIETQDTCSGKVYDHYKWYKVTPKMLRDSGKEAHFNLINDAILSKKEIPDNVMQEHMRIRIAKAKAIAKIKILKLK